MKPDTERKKYHKEKLHKRKKRLHAHLSKDLRSKLKAKKRSLQVRKGDTVKVMRGPQKGKEAKVSKVSTLARKIYLEGVTVTNARAKEVAIPMHPSNVLLIGLEATAERKKLFSEDAFKKPKIEKKEEKKAAAPKEVKPEEAKQPEEAKKPEKAERPKEAQPSSSAKPR